MTTCGQCGAEMQKVTERGGGLKLPVVALLVIGVGLLFVFPAGTAIGGFMIAAALILGYPRKKTWKCEKCGFQHV
jgi:hypothetical protein